MKTLVYSTVIALVAFLGNTNTVEAQHLEKTNYVVLTKKIPQLHPIILTAEALKKESLSHYGDFKVIVCGKKIGDITVPEKINQYLEMAKKSGVELIACGFSLDKFNVDRSKVPKAFEIVENGIHYGFQLQNKGYKSLSL